VDGGAFLCGREGNATRFERTISSPLAGAKSWCFADPAVEAQRLQEAAWRADTSELPEWIEGAIRFCKADNMELTLENLAWCAVQGNCENMEQATRFLVNELPCLLRWQAQQEQK